MKNSITCLVLAMHFSMSVWAQQENSQLVKAGNLYSKGQWAEALSVYQQILQRQPGNSTALYNLAVTEARLGKASEAIDHFQSAAAISSGNADKYAALYNAGTLLAGQKKFKEAFLVLKTALRINPQEEDCRQNLQRVINELKKQSPSAASQPPPPNEKLTNNNPPPPNTLTQQQIEEMLRAAQMKEREVQGKLYKEPRSAEKKNARDW